MSASSRSASNCAVVAPRLPAPTTVIFTRSVTSGGSKLMADFLTKKRSELERRLKELRPLHEEYIRLERAVEALGAVDGAKAPSTRGRRGASDGNGRRRRARRGGTRAEQALTAVRENPGITVSELGDK